LTSGGTRFGLAVATYREEMRREAVIARASAAAAPLRVARLNLRSEPGGDLAQSWRAALERAAEGVAGALLVTGLEPSLLDALGRVKQPVTPEIALLNQRRDQLPGLLPARVVLWLRPEAEQALALSARDLNEVVLTRFAFTESPPESGDAVRAGVEKLSLAS
jgi:hypothetical protein